jgi:16S rRNA (guanine527-N7)-methyltransferase
VGTGAGMPGIILAIAKPNSDFTLIDSNSKKVNFLNEVIQSLNLRNVKIIQIRAEEYNAKFDLVISRAVAPLPILLEITSNLCQIDGTFIFYKGKNIDSEMCENLLFNKYIGVSFIEVIKYNLNEENFRSLIVFKKSSKNKEGYPRHFSKIKSDNLCE